MKANRTLHRMRYPALTIYMALALLPWYGALVYRRIFCLGEWGSALLFWGSLILSLGCSLARSPRSPCRAAADAVTAYGAYTLLSYMGLWTGAILLLLAAASLPVWLALLRRIPCYVRDPRAARRHRLARAAGKAHRLYAGAAALVLAAAMACTLLRIPPLHASVRPVVQPEQTIANNMDMLFSLQEDAWETLSVRERLDVMQVVANIEARYLNLSRPLIVGAEPMESIRLAYYNSAGQIILNVRYVQNGTAAAVLDTVCHEAYHGYQHRLVELLETDADLLGVVYAEKARIYKAEFAAYTSGLTDYAAYAAQTCEIDARRYAQVSVQDYYARIQASLAPQAA